MLEAPFNRRAIGRFYSIAVVGHQGDGRIIVLTWHNFGESSVAVAAGPTNLRGENGECIQSTSVTIDGPARDLVFARVDSSLLKSARGDEQTSPEMGKADIASQFLRLHCPPPVELGTSRKAGNLAQQPLGGRPLPSVMESRLTELWNPFQARRGFGSEGDDKSDGLNAARVHLPLPKSRDDRSKEMLRKQMGSTCGVA